MLPLVRLAAKKNYFSLGQWPLQRRLQHAAGRCSAWPLLQHAGTSHARPVPLQERRMLVETLQEISKRRALRFSFISGDVHCCGLGQLYSDPKVG